MDNLEEAEREITAGNLWRAKEILHRSLKYSGYNVQLFEKLGAVLLQMHDLSEAGKYLFLSGVRKPEYEEAISVFLQKYKDKPHNLFHPFPRSAKLSKVSDYPKPVADKLRELGFSDGLETVHGIYSNRPMSNSGRLAIVVSLAVAFGIALLIILGVVKLFEMIF
jgi:tetratricopeptide (TPR) repeat protein